MAAVTPPVRARFWILVEASLATALALWLALRLERPSAWLAVPLLLLLLPGRRAEDYGLELRLRPPSYASHAAIAAAALAGYAVLHIAAARLVSDAELVPRLPPGFAMLAVTQILVVALPEELFFRGYLQDRLDRAFPPRRRFAGAPAGLALVLQAAIFALCHLAGGDWTRLRVFFFGLLAGWLRLRSGSIAAPVLYHAAANLSVAVLEASLGG